MAIATCVSKQLRPKAWPFFHTRVINITKKILQNKQKYNWNTQTQYLTHKINYLNNYKIIITTHIHI